MTTAPDSAASETQTGEKSLLKRELGFFDLTLFYIAGALSLRWIATAAAAGPSTLVIWVFAFFCFFIPLAASVLELSSRYPQEGGVYIWTQRAFGDFSGFMCAWTYWMSNLPYFPAILYFGAGSVLFAFPHGQRLSNNSSYYLIFSLSCLALITLLNVIGLKFGKWLNSFGAIGSWLPVIILLVLAMLSFSRYGSATRFTPASMRPHLGLKNAIFWSTIFYAFAGCETGSFFGEEIKNSRRAIPRALIISGVVLAVSYIAGTIALLVALPSTGISGVGGFASAIQVLCTRLGMPWIVVVIALLVAVSSIGGAAVFLSSTSRLPFVAGIDRYLPAAFGRVHPQWGTPWVAITFYGIAGMLCALLSQAGSTVEGAYDLLVSMSIITYFIPFVFLFLSMIKIQREPAPPEVIRLPGGKPVAIFIASVGLVTTILAILLSVVPSSDDPHKALSVAKILGSTALLVGAGAAVSWSAKWRKK
jgi:amino acid transporter